MTDRGYIVNKTIEVSNGYVVTEWLQPAQQWLRYTLHHKRDPWALLDITASEARAELATVGK